MKLLETIAIATFGVFLSLYLLWGIFWIWDLVERRSDKKAFDKGKQKAYEKYGIKEKGEKENK